MSDEVTEESPEFLFPPGATFYVDSEALGRALNNALSNVPAKSSIPVVHLSITTGQVRAFGTDTYTAGRDSVRVQECTTPLGFGDTWEGDISREDAVEFERIARMDKSKKGQEGLGAIVLEQDPDDPTVTRLHFFPNSGGEAFMAEADVTGEYGDLWDRIEEYFDHPHPFRTAFQPGLLQRLAKVKTDSTDRVADIAIGTPDDPVLVKIGPTYNAIIMPVYREVHAEKIGSDGLF